MTRFVQVVVLALLMAAAPAVAQVAPDLGEIRQKTSLTADDRSRIQAYVQQEVQVMLTNMDPDRRGMVAARENILEEVQSAENRTEAYRQAFAEEALAVLAKTAEKAVSQPARVNFVMTLARLQVIEAAPLLQSALADPYAASRYWAAKGLAMLAPKIVARVVPRLEGEIADSIEKMLQTRQQHTMVLIQLFDALGKLDHERAHDVLAAGVVQVAKGLDASDPVVRRMVSEAIRSLERAYSREVRPDAKKNLLLAYAALCAHIMPPIDVSPVPAGYARLMAELNASLEQITGEDVGFEASDPLALQKLALLEWVERLARTKRIPKRPEMPAAVEQAVKEGQSGGGATTGKAANAAMPADKAGT
ncbi:MAG: hypothetical protein U9R68_01210 [Planctomycetota bacterium]|nr:hypothetical protein [Planctomycetota bacterium]